MSDDHAARATGPEPPEDALVPPSAEDLFDGEIAYPPEPSDADRQPRRRRSVRQPPRADVDLDVPYVHQLWDTPADFNGHWACGPACAVMVLASYGLLSPRALELARPQPHVSDYGWYVPSSFTHASASFDAVAATPSGTAAGVYGTVVDRIGNGWGAHYHNANGRGFGPLFAAFLPAVGNDVRCVVGPKRDASVFMQRAPAERIMLETLDEGHPLIVSGRFDFHGRAYDHLIVVRGYYRDMTSSALHWIVNDPYGFETSGSTHDGDRVAYTFDEIRPKWMCVFRGPHTTRRDAVGQAHIPVRLFDRDTNEHIGDGTLIDGTDKVYIKWLR